MGVMAYVGLGANLGPAEQILEAAVTALGRLPGTCLLARSPTYRTAPVDAAGPDFLNLVVGVDTDLSPRELLAALHGLEQAHGRERPYRNAPRTLDLDLLLHGQARIDTPDLIVPHPRLHERAFVLVPLADIAPHLDVPGHGPIGNLLPGVAGQRIERLAP